MHFCFSILGVCHFQGEKGHQDTCTCLCQYMARDLENLQEEHTIRAHALTSQRFSKMAPDTTSPPSAQLHCMLTLAHVREYV
jgi:hypothetical protein